MSAVVRPLREGDREAWAPLWEGYNAFYGRHGAAALDPAVTDAAWRRFLDPDEAMFALLAELDGAVVGLAHYLWQRSTTRLEPTCYLQDLFAAPAARGRGVGRQLVEAVCERAAAAGVQRVYWHTQAGNATARRLYDRLARDSGFVVYVRDV